MTDEKPNLLHALKPKFRAILADPPWRFKSYAASANPESDRHVERHYSTMTLDEIKALDVASVAHADGCHLFLWTTGPFLPKSLDVIEAWGFRYSAIAFTWVKLLKTFETDQLRFIPADEHDFHVSLGFTTRKNTELCLLARRGNAKRVARNVRELITSPRREHSRKPDETHERIEQYCAGPYLELFGRSERKGWIVRGDEVGKFKT
jgi:N6-adenosine-specific RNA methylase IME4